MKIKESTLLDNTFMLNATFSKSGIIFAGMGLFFKIICFFKNQAACACVNSRKYIISLKWRYSGREKL